MSKDMSIEQSQKLFDDFMKIDTGPLGPEIFPEPDYPDYEVETEFLGEPVCFEVWGTWHEPMKRRS